MIFFVRPLKYANFHREAQLGQYRTKKIISRKLKYIFTKKTTPKLLGHIGLQNTKVGEKTNFGRLATIFQICSMDADILS